VVALDGKVTALPTLNHPLVQNHVDGQVVPFGLVRTVTCSLVSARGRPCIDAIRIPAGTNEMGHFQAAFASLLGTYRGLFDVVTYDAGALSEANASAVVDAGKDYVFRLRGEQRYMFKLAEQLLDPADAVARTVDVLDNETTVTRTPTIPRWRNGSSRTLSCGGRVWSGRRSSSRTSRRAGWRASGRACTSRSRGLSWRRGSWRHRATPPRGRDSGLRSIARWGARLVTTRTAAAAPRRAPHPSHDVGRPLDRALAAVPEHDARQVATRRHLRRHADAAVAVHARTLPVPLSSEPGGGRAEAKRDLALVAGLEVEAPPGVAGDRRSSVRAEHARAGLDRGDPIEPVEVLRLVRGEVDRREQRGVSVDRVAHLLLPPAEVLRLQVETDRFSASLSRVNFRSAVSGLPP
jgi:hypothetical protein